MELPLEGGCCCGAVRYTCSAAPQMIFNCHCKDCQKLAGGPCTTAVLVPTECLEIQGVLTRYTSTGDNGGKVHHCFCPSCGTPVSVDPEVFEGLTSIKATSLDDNGWVRPSMDIFTKSAQPWIRLSSDTDKFAEGPL